LATFLRAAFRIRDTVERWTFIFFAAASCSR